MHKMKLVIPKVSEHIQESFDLCLHVTEIVNIMLEMNFDVISKQANRNLMFFQHYHGLRNKAYQNHHIT